MRITSDIFHSNNRLVNGTPYYFAVTAYNYNPDQFAIPSTLETSIKVIAVTPHSRGPGTRYVSAFGDTVKGVAQSVASGGSRSDGAVIPLVIDPTRLTGHTYRVNFDTAGGAMTWRLTDQTSGQIRLSKQTNQTGDETSPMVDGMMIKVLTAPDDATNFLHVKNPSGNIVPPTYVGFSTFNSLGFPDPNPSSTGGPVADYGDGGRWGIHTGGGGAGAASSLDATYAGRFKPRTFRSDNFSRFVPYDFEIRFTAAGGKGFLAYSSGKFIDVPFELWNIGSNTPNDPSDDFRMIPWINDEDGSGVFQLMKYDHSASGADNDPYTSWIYWMDASPKSLGSAGYDSFFAAGSAYDGSQGTGKEVMARMVLVNINGGSVSAPTWPANVNSRMPATGNVIRIISGKLNNPSVSFTFTAPLNIIGNADTARNDIRQINVFPNPYYAVNPQELKTAEKFVTFSQLPVKAIVRIFNLGGVMVRRLDKDMPSQFLRWDLKNEAGLPVGSGLYIAYIEMPDLGVTKTLKLAIVQEQQVIE